jgi:hypothetical protein
MSAVSAAFFFSVEDKRILLTVKFPVVIRVGDAIEHHHSIFFCEHLLFNCILSGVILALKI